jgi:hypothetical protein
MAEIYPVRQPVPIGSSTWNPSNLAFNHFPNDLPRAVSEDGQVELAPRFSIGSSRKGRSVWKSGSIQSIPEDQMLSVSGDLISEPKREEKLDKQGLPSGRYAFYANSQFRFESSNIDQAIYVQDVKTNRSRSFPALDSLAFQESRFHISPYNDFTFLSIDDQKFSVQRSIDLQDPQIIEFGEFSQSVSIVNALPAKLKPGSHLILNVDGVDFVVSDGQKWNLEVPSGFIAVPKTFVTPDIVAGRLMKYSTDGLIQSATIAFWNRKGQLCIIEDALPERRSELNTLLSTREGFNRGSNFVSNYLGTLAISLNNASDWFTNSSDPTKSSESRSGTLILKLTP